jgi:hypothetical protein
VATLLGVLIDTPWSYPVPALLLLGTVAYFWRWG